MTKGRTRTSNQSRPVRRASMLCHIHPPTSRATRSQLCAPGLCLTHMTRPRGSFPGETEPSTTSHTERVHQLRKSPFENVCGQHAPSPHSSDGIMDLCTQHRRGTHPRPAGAQHVSALSAWATGFCHTRWAITCSQSISLCFRIVFYIVFFLLGNTIVRFKSKQPQTGRT